MVRLCSPQAVHGLIFIFVFIFLFNFMACDRGDVNNEPVEGSTSLSTESNTLLAVSFPEEFQFGVAMSAYQTEGGNNNSDYEEWVANGGGDQPCGKADNSYELYEEDIRLSARMGVKLLRTGIEWSRVQPERGVYDQKELDHYRKVFEALRKAGINPVVTLHHFTNPIWFHELGGWLRPEAIDDFTAYAARMAEEYGDLVDHWITINEPNVYFSGTYLMDAYPGGELLNLQHSMQAFGIMALAHAGAYHAIKENDQVDADGDGVDSLVYVAFAISPVGPCRENNLQDKQAASNWDYFYHLNFINAVVNGQLDMDFNGKLDNTNVYPPEGFYPELKGTLDMIGINYYNGIKVLYLPLLLNPIHAVPCYFPFDFLCDPANLPKIRGDNGNEVDPSGIMKAIKELSSYGLPLIISENGIATTDDYKRIWFTLEHLYQVASAIQQGYDVRGYLHWSLLDNFEWAYGYSMRFGLIRVDFETFERKWTESAEAYRIINKARGIPYSMFYQYEDPPKIGN